MTTNQTERVPDEELDQMIWKLERDGMTPKQLSLMRELRELRRNSPATPDGWIPVSERMPDPKSELRVCVYTPTPHEDIRYRFVPASLFKAVCRDATHWQYMSAPKEVG